MKKIYDNIKSFREFEIFEAMKKNIGVGGDCYLANAKHFQDMADDDENLVLVHGYVISQTQQRVKYDHCWIENDDTVFDFSNGRELEIPKQVYYALGHIKDSESFKYNEKELRKKVLKYKTWGPWDLEIKNERL